MFFCVFCCFEHVKIVIFFPYRVAYFTVPGKKRANTYVVSASSSLVFVPHTAVSISTILFFVTDLQKIMYIFQKMTKYCARIAATSCNDVAPIQRSGRAANINRDLKVIFCLWLRWPGRWPSYIHMFFSAFRVL